ncbi:MAG: type II secretion system protein [Caulobacteraceae bacterium]|nr:type II secretion system protein [Caulobacteraceae bacterium]
MNQDGYTLAETLAALVMIGLAMGGLTAGVRVIGLNQAATGRNLVQGQDLRVADQALSRLFQDQGPFLSSDSAGLRGATTELSFPCGASVCGAKILADGAGSVLRFNGRASGQGLHLPRAQSARFAYVGTAGLSDRWPPRGAGQDTLRGVMVLADNGRGESPVADARLWRDQPVACAFDPISQVCRAPTP